MIEVLKNKKIKTYVFLALVIFVSILLAFPKPTKLDVPADRTATYLLTDKQTQLGNHFLDSSLGKTALEVQSTNPGLRETASKVTSSGYIHTNFRDESNTPVEIVSNSNGEVVAIIRLPVDEFEKKQESIVQRLGLSEPNAVMYPTEAGVAVINVYPREGIAIYYEREFDRVEYVITFESMSLDQFKKVFADKYQDTRNSKAY